MPKSIPLEIRLQAVKLHREHGLTILDAAKAVGAGRRTLIRWLSLYAPRKTVNAFTPIVLDGANPPVASPISVVVNTSDGTTVRLQLHSLDAAAQLIRSLR